MKKSCKYLRNAKAVCLIGVFVAIGLAAAFLSSNSGASTLPTAIGDLRGEEAFDYLKQQDIHESLQAAVMPARQNDELVDPQIKVTTSDGEADDRCGSAVAVSGDTAVVGCPWDTIGSNDRQGSAYVFVRGASGWTQQQKLTFSPAANEEFGAAVAINGDTIIIGAPIAQVGGSSGVGYVFTRAGSTWTHQQVLTGAGGAIKVGTSVAIDGDTIVLGSDHSGTSPAGKAVVYFRTGNTWQLQQTLAASDGAPSDWFGLSVGVSGDTIIVGAGSAVVNGDLRRGAAYVYGRTGSNWSELQKLIAPDGDHDDQFGRTADISGDRIVVGAPVDENLATENRGLYVFSRTLGAWALHQKISPSGGHIGDFFGGSLSIDGDNVLAGAFRHNIGSNSRQGTVYHFQLIGANWLQQRRLVASDGAEQDLFGVAVDISSGTSVVGSMDDDIGANADQGSAYIFECGRTSQQSVTASDGAAFDRFGSSVAVSGDTVVVGVPSKIEPGSATQGAAYVFARGGAGWIQQAKLKAAPALNGAEFGRSVAISGDTIVVGAWKESVAANDTQGAAYVFVRNGTQWTQQARLLASDGAFNDQFGSAVSIDGNTIAIGAPFDDTGGNSNQGSVYVYTRTGTTWTQQTRLSSSNGAANDNFGSSVDIDGESIAAGAYQKGLFRGEAYVFTRSGSVWTQQQSLAAVDGVAGDEFGFAVSIDGDKLAIGAQRDDTDQFQDHGSVYVYLRNGTTWTPQQEKIVLDSTPQFTQFGAALALEGDSLLIGQNGGLSSAWIFVPNGDAWIVEDVLTGTALSDFGSAVAMSGVTIAVGALAKTVGGNTQQGEATIYYGDCSTAPTASVAQPISRRRCKPATSAELGIVSDGQSAPGSLSVTAQTVPIGITLTNVLNTNGAVTATVGAECTATLGAHTVVLRVSDSSGGAANFNVTINVVNETPADFDGDGKSDISIWRPSNGNWWIQQSSNNGVSVTAFGVSLDRIVPGDYDGDGKTEIAVFRPATGVWYWLKSSDGSFAGIQWGINGDIPAAADFDGDTKTDLAVFRPSNGVWYVLKSSDNGFIAFNFGVSGDRPVAGDYDGDGRADFAVFRPSTSVWYLQKSTAGFSAAQFGIATDKPVQSDYDGDGKTDIAVYRPTEGVWYLMQSNAGLSIQQWGVNGDIPSSGDYDGDGKSDVSVFRPSSGTWYVSKSAGGTITTQFGTNGDVPVESGYFPP